MAYLRLQNPYHDEEIKVEEDYTLITDMMGWLERGNIPFLQLHQIEPEERFITISPQNFAKIDLYDDKEE